MAPNFYREVDLVKEQVIPPMSEVVLSSNAKEAAPQNIESKKLSYELQDLLGENKLAYGISLRTPEPLINFFGAVRGKLSNGLEFVENKIDRSSQAYYDKERKVTSAIADLHSDPKEQLLPGFTYILVASMSGSILTRNRNIFLRGVTPVVFGISCFSYVLPTTYRNTKRLAYDIEKRNFPVFVSRQDKLYNATMKAACNTAYYTKNVAATVKRGYERTNKAIKEWTGLNV
ncbi:Mic26p [Kluyveromyces lactis]|uniref:MICOS complex subunit n=1 Tax=Kluyveromyces lactis (strain ATCC 8585 / CBS 2359 / DSM 70799 / NBRC 1267 / NRRL Y-1140 / WM37) TaxID=284590 RepID=Q6CN35_KLULA|nr:uncharacterized protein KLLA0_E15599g [Kluyveromyces lactis]CAG99741.1 KLLA0E15599p [Kluyveromyces lactis]|eukprot:XP_454654.1 uncharacterized protein KLLA0_E15599g [Kluyveromyces lactis]